MAEKGTLDFGIGKEDDGKEFRDFVREKSDYDDSEDGKRKKFEKDGINSRKRKKKLKSKSEGRDGSKLKLKKAGDSGERSRDQNGEAEVKEMWDTIARGDSKIRIYTPKRVFQELEVAKEEYIRATFGVRKDQKILLPKTVESAKDSRLCPTGLLEMIQQCVPESVRKSIKKYQARKSQKSIEWISYNFVFQYLISKELVK